MSEPILIAIKLDDGLYVSIEQVNELKAKLKAENESLKAKLENVYDSIAFNSLDALKRERRLKRALYKACANWAVCEIDYWRKCLEHTDDYFDVRTGQDLDAKRCERMISNWIDAKIKCLKTAEEYK